MIVIYDNDFKLLKMNESLLSKIKDKELIDKTIKDYSLLAKKIDERNYQEFISRIKNRLRLRIVLEVLVRLLASLFLFVLIFVKWFCVLSAKILF